MAFNVVQEEGERDNLLLGPTYRGSNCEENEVEDEEEQFFSLVNVGESASERGSVHDDDHDDLARLSSCSSRGNSSDEDSSLHLGSSDENDVFEEAEEKVAVAEEGDSEALRSGDEQSSGAEDPGVDEVRAAVVESLTSHQGVSDAAMRGQDAGDQDDEESYDSSAVCAKESVANVDVEQEIPGKGQKSAEIPRGKSLAARTPVPAADVAAREQKVPLRVQELDVPEEEDEEVSADEVNEEALDPEGRQVERLGDRERNDKEVLIPGARAVTEEEDPGEVLHPAEGYGSENLGQRRKEDVKEEQDCLEESASRRRDVIEEVAFEKSHADILESFVPGVCMNDVNKTESQDAAPAEERDRGSKNVGHFTVEPLIRGEGEEGVDVDSQQELEGAKERSEPERSDGNSIPVWCEEFSEQTTNPLSTAIISLPVITHSSLAACEKEEVSSAYQRIPPPPPPSSLKQHFVLQGRDQDQYEDEDMEAASKYRDDSKKKRRKKSSKKKPELAQKAGKENRGGGKSSMQGEEILASAEQQQLEGEDGMKKRAKEEKELVGTGGERHDDVVMTGDATDGLSKSDSGFAEDEQRDCKNSDEQLSLQKAHDLFEKRVGPQLHHPAVDHDHEEEEDDGHLFLKGILISATEKWTCL